MCPDLKVEQTFLTFEAHTHTPTQNTGDKTDLEIGTQQPKQETSLIKKQNKQMQGGPF